MLFPRNVDQSKNRDDVSKETVLSFESHGVVGNLSLLCHLFSCLEELSRIFYHSRAVLAKTMLTNRYVLYVPKNWRWLWFVEYRTCRGQFFAREKKRRVLTKPQPNYWPHKSVTLFQLKHTKESQNSMPKRPWINHLEVSSEHKFFEHLIKQRHGIRIRCLVSQHWVLLASSQTIHK